MPKLLSLLIIIFLFPSCKGCDTNKTETQKALGVSMDASTTNDSTYSVTHDSIFHKTITNIVKVPYDTTVSIQSTIDSTVKHDSLTHYSVPVTSTTKVSSIVKTTHDTTKSTIASTTYKTTHDSFYCKTVWIFFKSCKPRSVTHDTTTYTKITSTQSITHDTTIYTLKTDTIGYTIKDTIVKAIHDTTLLITVQYHETLYKDSIIYTDVPFTAPTTHDTTVSVIVVTPPPPIIEYGAKLQGSLPDQIAAQKLMGTNLKWIRTGIYINQFTGTDKGLDQQFAAGYKVACNISYPTLAKKPYPFYKDTVNYEKLLRVFFDKYGAKFSSTGSFVLCENEPTNTGYYGTAPMSDYLALLRTLTRVAHSYGVKVADGCTFIEYLHMIFIGSWPTRVNDNIQETKQILEGLKTIPVDYVNAHITIQNDDISPYLIKEALDYLRSYTGHDIAITNEYHYENCHAGTGIVDKVIREWQLGNTYICILWSGDKINGVLPPGSNSDADGFSNGNSLTDLGIEFKDAIK